MSSSGPSLPPQNPTRQRIWLGENDPNRSPRQQLLRLLKGGFVALAGGYMLGFASYFLDRAGYLSGIARRADVIIARRGLTAEVPGRLERYEWTARLIPEKEYHGGERVVAWPELVISYTADDGHTRWIRVRGQPDNTDTIPTYMAHFAGIFGLPWIDYVLDPDVMRRLRYDPRRPPGWSNQPRFRCRRRSVPAPGTPTTPRWSRRRPTTPWSSSP